MKDKLIPDFGVLSFCGEVRKNRGEDCCYYNFCEQIGVIAVFDGCGGSGARRRHRFCGQTDAFIASRVAASVVDKWMQTYLLFPEVEIAHKLEILCLYLRKTLNRLVEEEKDEEIIHGFLSFPTTMSAILIRKKEEQLLELTSVNAGDSRSFLLTPIGLYQLSMDDTDQPDPFENLYCEGAIEEVINGDKPFGLKYQTLEIFCPCIIFCATDGCFDYLSTPMEFEGILLGTLMESSSVTQWKENLQKLIYSVAGDDHTLCLASFDFTSFEEMQQVYRNRYHILKSEFLDVIWEAAEEDIALRRRLWKRYSKDYMKYLKGKNFNGVPRKL